MILCTTETHTDNHGVYPTYETIRQAPQNGFQGAQNGFQGAQNGFQGAQNGFQGRGRVRAPQYHGGPKTNFDYYSNYPDSNGTRQPSYSYYPSNYYNYYDNYETYGNQV